MLPRIVKIGIKNRFLLPNIIKRLSQYLIDITSVFQFHKKRYRDYLLRRKSMEIIFTDIYKNNAWEGGQSISGPGSDRIQTRNIIKELPILFEDFNISTVLDIPCGDFYWMSVVNLNGKNYIGMDIVKDLITKNKQFESNNISFKAGNLMIDQLPAVDLIMCRDCFIHFSFDHIYLALENICRSASKYLITSTYIARRENPDIITGRGRVLNLEIKPFNFPKPLRTILEDCTLQDGKYMDKSFALWRIEDIKECLIKRSS